MTHLRGYVALVTGSSRGIGRAVAKELASSGADIVVNYFEHHDEAYSLREEIQALGRDVEVVQADISDPQLVKVLVESAINKFGQIDILINNAGITRDRTLKKMSFEEWEQVLQVNLSGVFNSTKMVIPYMIERQKGSIVNIASVIGQTGAFGQTNYSAAKAGVIGFTKSCALELAHYGITVNAVCPGFVETDMLKAVPDDIRENIRQRIPLRRFASPADVARCVRFLVTEGQYFTGQCLNLNGGLFM